MRLYTPLALLQTSCLLHVSSSALGYPQHALCKYFNLGILIHLRCEFTLVDLGSQYDLRELGCPRSRAALEAALPTIDRRDLLRESWKVHSISRRYLPY